MPYCPSCGEEVQNVDEFCRHCGNSLSTESSSAGSATRETSKRYSGTGSGPLQEALGPHAAELDEAAATEDDPAVADACAILAACARGEGPPEAACRRAVRRAKERQNG